MYYTVEVQVCQTFEDLMDVGCGLLLAEVAGLLYLVVEIVGTGFHYQVYFRFGEEKTICRKNIRMPTVELDFKLINHKIDIYFLSMETF